MSDEIYEDDEGSYDEEGERLITVKDIYAGLRISRSYAYKIVNSGELAVLQLGRRKFVYERDLMRWIDEHYHPARSDVDEEDENEPPF